MAAVVGTSVTPVTLSINTGAEITYTDATNSGTLVTDTETFEFTPTKDDNKVVIYIKNGCGATVTANVVKGEMWAGTANSATATIATGKTFGFTIDSAKFKTNAGKIKVLVTPTAGTALNASAKVQVGVVQRA